MLLISPTVSATAADSQPETGGKLVAVEYARTMIYHSPQTPGFTCWVGAWTMRDDSLMVCFTQATGPLQDRPRAPKDVQTKLNWPHNDDPRYDMTGLDLRNVHLRSSDGGATWQEASADSFRSPMNGVTGECATALRDGTIVRGVFGFYLPYNPELPQTGFLQRSRDDTRTWSKAEVPLDPSRFTCWPRRLRQLRDGRLLLLGGLARVPTGSRTRLELGKLLEPLMLVSADAGKTWSGPIAVVPENERTSWTEEFDAAELPSGDLLCVFRRPDPKTGREGRWQGLIKKKGATWIPPHTLSAAPFPHSGHPELLATREGVILHLATSGIHWTSDAGASWQRMDIPGTGYYPRSVQTVSGRIHVFAHRGSDDPYGAVDQAIIMDTFRVAVDRRAP